MGQPKVGMEYEDVRKRVKRIENNSPSSEGKTRLVSSLLNQTRLCDGDKAVSELSKELYPVMGTKSRGNFRIGVCLKTCKCPECRKKKDKKKED